MAAAELGGKPGDFVGKSLHDILPKDEADRFVKRIHEIIESGKGHNIEEFVDLPTGRRWFSSNIQPIVRSIM